jgi:hypothetical protein
MKSEPRGRPECANETGEPCAHHLHWATMANVVPSCYRRNVGLFAPRSMRLIASAALALSFAACSRTGFEDLVPTGTTSPPSGTGGTENTDARAATSLDATVPVNSGGTNTGGASAGGASSTKPATGGRAGCTPHAETCNGKDDDCNGLVDDGLPSIPCANGGEQDCVAGRYSACPTRCEACVPGSERVCFLSYCTYWATETCAADGRSFGSCKERHVPPECEGVSDQHKDSAELEQCCIDNGYCCHDEYDLDGDGNRGEMLGQCGEVSCSP